MRVKQSPFLILFNIAFLWAFNGFSQNTSNKGTEFWIAYASNSDDANSRLSLFLTSTTDAVVNITAGGTPLPPVTVAAGQAVPVVINPNIYSNAYVDGSDIVKGNAGIHVTSDVPIIVYAHMSHSARSASSLILPVKALGNEYYPISYVQRSGAERYSEFTVVGVEDNTTVEITPSVNSINNTKTAGQSFQIALNKGDVYQYKSATDVTGTYIKTIGDCKPVAVFSGSTFTAFCEEGNNRPAGSGDPLFQQLFPVSAWGKNFITAPYYNAQNGSSDIIRIQVAKNNTTVRVNGSETSASGTTLNNPYQAGDVITFPTNAASRITADFPIAVAQFQVTQACNPNNTGGVQFPGDPEMTILNPIEQTLKDITVYSAVNYPAAPTSITRHYLNIILKTGDIPNLKVDGKTPAGSFKSIDSEYSFITVDVTSSSAANPAHQITSKEGFIAIAYGYGSVESYAYLAGADLKNLSANILISDPGSTSAKSELCAEVNYDVTLQLPYITDRITWDLKNGSKTETVSSPSYTTWMVNGVTSYLYKYGISATDISAAGVYDLKATVLNPAPTSCTAEEEVSTSFEVFNLPTPAFSTDRQSTCEGLKVTFTDASLGNGSIITKWLWDYGDGTTEIRTSGTPFEHIYQTEGDYAVTLSVETDKGCSSAETLPYIIHVFKSPDARFSVTSLTCESQAITFTDQSVANEGSISSWIWNFGDSTSLTTGDNLPVQHAYSAAGTYTVSLKVITDAGCESEVFSKIVEVHPLPEVDFETPDVCLSDSFAQFKDLTTIDDNTEADFTYLWNFGDPSSGVLNTSTEKDPKHKYLQAAAYTVTLTVISKYGCAVTAFRQFTVNGATPKAAFTVLNAEGLCSNQPVTFQDGARVDFGEITRIEWYYDLNNDLSAAEVDDAPGKRNGEEKVYSHSYPAFTSPASKNYTVRMVAYSGSTCVDDETKTITIMAVPEVVFASIPSICTESGPILLNQASEFNNSPGTGVYSGTGVSSTGVFDPDAAGPGTHSITYTFTAINGCTDQKSQDIIVYQSPSVNAGTDVRILEGGQITLNPVSASGANLTYQWSPSTGLSDDDIPNPVASPLNDITYTLTVTTDEGCSASDEIAVTVLKGPEVPNAFTPNNDGINDLWNIKYLESYPGCTVQVYNRYGASVFAMVGYAAPWDGKYKGEDLPPGTYYYVIDPKNGRKKMTGSLTILR